MKTMVRYLFPYRFRIIIGLSLKMCSTILELFIPRILAHIINNIVPTKNISMVLLFGLCMMLCATLSAFTNITANRMAVKVAMLSAEKMRYDAFRKVIYLSSGQIDGLSISSIISRLSSDTYTLHNYIGMMQRMGIRAPILLLGGLIMTMTLDFRLSLILMVMVPLVALIIYFVTTKGIPLFLKTRLAGDRLVECVRETSSGIRVIKALSKEPYQQDKFFAINEDVRQANISAETTMAKSKPMIDWLLNVGMLLVILIGAVLVNRGQSQVGTIIAFTSYFTIILNSVVAVTRIFVRSSNAAASASRLEEILKLPEDLLVEAKESSAVSEDLLVEAKESFIEFNEVTFSYNKIAPDLDHLSFRLAKGETLGIIGGTGSGKTTIINLLLRLYDCDSGDIRINGRNIKTIPKQELHQLFGVVFQDDILFNDTIRENICFGRSLDEERIVQASENAQAEEFIRTFPEQYDYLLAVRGKNISGGQKQRILISRALADHPPILILDDATSALDYKTDAKLRKKLSANFEDTTKIIIAQRISSILHAEHIIVLDQGKPIGHGTHEELLASCEMYQRISQSQIGDSKLLVNLVKEGA